MFKPAKFRIIVCRAALLFAAAVSIAVSAHAQMPKVLPGGLGKGINFGNMLEAPFEGAWGLTVQPDFFARVAEAEFDHIRLPVSWTHHALLEAPYTVDPAFFTRVDEVLAMAEAIGVKVILNDHHHDELDENPLAERERFLAIWDQIATRYADRGDWLYFEVLNEPHGQFNDVPELWNQLLADSLALIRTTNPTRIVLIGPVFFNSIDRLEALDVPDDPNLIASIHYYDPFPFTHQGATWVEPNPPVGVRWRPLFKALTPPWQNYSWQTKVDETGTGLRVTYQAGWAGFFLHTDQPFADAQAIQFRVNRPYRFRVVVESGEDQYEYFVDSTATPQNPITYVVNFDGLPDGTPLTDVFIQNYSPTAKTPMIVSLLRVKLNGKWRYIMTTKRNVIRMALIRARDWAIENNIPLHLGEFGAYSLGNYSDRVVWTRTVRHYCDQMGIDWSYWEFGAGFGIYDPDTETWRTRLRRALLP